MLTRYILMRSRIKKSSRRRTRRRGGGLVNKTDCERLFAAKGTSKWAGVQDNSFKTRMKYSLCKRIHRSLYNAYKQSLKNDKTGKPKLRGIVFDPSIKGKDAKTIQYTKLAETEAHKWLDKNGWTDKNLTKAQKMKEQRLSELLAS